MNKNEFMQELHKSLKDNIQSASSMSKNDISKLIDIFFSTIMNKLKDDGSVRMVKFGTWSVVETKARKGRNPSTGAILEIPAKMSIKFRPGKEFKDMMEK